MMRFVLQVGLVVTMVVFGGTKIAFGQSPPSNSDCLDAIEIYLGTTSFTTLDATTDGIAHDGCLNEGQTYNDIWYTFTSGATGTLVISTCGLLDWGNTSGDEDINHDGIVGVDDLLALIGAWGECPLG